MPVLDHGFVRVIDYMGDDTAIVQAARVSYGKGTNRFPKFRIDKIFNEAIVLHLKCVNKVPYQITNFYR